MNTDEILESAEDHPFFSGVVILIHVVTCYYYYHTACTGNIYFYNIYQPARIPLHLCYTRGNLNFFSGVMKEGKHFAGRQISRVICRGVVCHLELNHRY